MGKTKLLKCPFCGNIPELWDFNNQGKNVRIVCTNPECMVHTEPFKSRKFAIEHWNRRTPPSDNCTNAECPYQRGTPCPASDGCGGFIPGNKPLTVEELRERKKPVWCDISDCEWIPAGGYYCLCDGGRITAPSGQRFGADECLKNGWVLLDRPPEEGE